MSIHFEFIVNTGVYLLKRMAKPTWRAAESCRIFWKDITLWMILLGINFYTKTILNDTYIQSQLDYFIALQHYFMISNAFC